jgi:hypothetical protein
MVIPGRNYPISQLRDDARPAIQQQGRLAQMRQQSGRFAAANPTIIRHPRGTG